jgi:hypothetical protein
VPTHPVSVDHVEHVEATSAEVWAVVADASKRPDWMTELRRVDAAPGTLHVGDRFVGESSILLHDFIGASTVVTAEPERLLLEEVVIGARFRSRWELTSSPDGRGSEVRHTIDVDFPAGPFSGVERWILRRRLLRMQKASLRALARRFSS